MDLKHARLSNGELNAKGPIPLLISSCKFNPPTRDFFFKPNYLYFTSMRPCNRFLRSFKRFKRAQNGVLFIDWLMEIYSHVVMAVTGRRKRLNGGWSLILSKRCGLCPCSNLLWISRSRQHLIVMITMIRP